MNLRYVASCGLVCAAFALAGCDQGRQTPGTVTVRAVNVAPSFVELQFRREQDFNRAVALGFKSAQEFSYDADTYDFFVAERSLDPNVTGRTWTVEQQMRENHSYTIVLTEVGGEVIPVVIEHPAAAAADSQIAVLHAANGLPAIDVYLERPGVGIAGATPRASLAVQEQLTPLNLASGEYELFLTEAGTPANVLLATETLTLAAGATATFLLVAESGEGTAPLSVVLLQAAPAVLYDRNATAEIRVINGATDTVPRDFAINREFAPPLFSAIPFAAPTPYATVPVGTSLPINVTPVGNQGVLELDQTLTTAASQRLTLLFAGPAGTLLHTIVRDDGRRIANEAKLRFFNAATQFTAIGFVLTTPGTDPTNVLAQAQLAAPGAADYASLPAGNYDLYLREAAATTLLSGPTPITVVAGGLYGAIAVNGADTATAGVVLVDDFP
jgi:hypothetical protein